MSNLLYCSHLTSHGTVRISFTSQFQPTTQTQRKNSGEDGSLNVNQKNEVRDLVEVLNLTIPVPGCLYPYLVTEKERRT